MSVSPQIRYRPAFLEGNKNVDFLVMVPSTIALDEGGFIKDPESHFEIGSEVLLVSIPRDIPRGTKLVPSPYDSEFDGMDEPVVGSDLESTADFYVIEGFIPDGRTMVRNSGLNLAFPTYKPRR